MVYRHELAENSSAPPHTQQWKVTSMPLVCWYRVTLILFASRKCSAT